MSCSDELSLEEFDAHYEYEIGSLPVNQHVEAAMVNYPEEIYRCGWCGWPCASDGTMLPLFPDFAQLYVKINADKPTHLVHGSCCAEEQQERLNESYTQYHS